MTIDSEVDTLCRVPLFKGIDAKKLRLLAFISERTCFRSGEHLCSQGERGDSAFIILKGEADVVVTTESGEQVVAQVGANDIVGEIAILCDVPRTASLVAVSDMDVLTISKESFLKLLKEFPEMALEVMRALAQRLEKTTRDLSTATAILADQAAG
ncbi:Cyclic nucleotide-binding domain-containing protein [Breoghania corrubedonensis]|uniref:Cyclic nucleotide-binding domain-containing protein n=1 Tax=Breoghania corrubedonensis TaxID=665038 RepID=A0A2T5V1G8_9HYPH|nr:cyclic nucleotide-binding domain-containing protein [Breoghania corrubedonensis]PTW57603.1 Cyclic nucleotide-binding domain-containing protein [Breoghania corrubedonensis]